MSNIIAIDQGTTSSRTIIFDDRGSVISHAQKEFQQFYPKNGWVEHDLDEIWKTQVETVLEAFNSSGLKTSDIASIGITNQRETLAVWERKTGNPLHKAIVWQDRRTANLISKIKNEKMEKEIRNKTGLPLDPYFSGTKIKWILDHCPEIYDKAKRGEVCFGTIDSWLIYKLTSGKNFLTDVTNASRTLLMDINKGQWDKELTELMGIEIDWLAEILPSSGYFGSTNILGSSVPINSVAGDQQSALFGQFCFQIGDVKNTYGTGCFILAYTGNNRVESSNNLLTTVAWQLSNNPINYALEGSVFIGGAAIQWLRDGLEIIENSIDVNQLAKTVNDTRGVYVVPAFTGLGAPYWDPKARGIITGLTRGTTKAHIARAVLESIALQSAEVIQGMSKDLDSPVLSIRADGGASASNLLMTMQADYSGCKVLRPSTLETTALGTALLAALGKGLYSSPNELSKVIKPEKIFLPKMNKEKREKKLKEWKKVVSAAMFLTS